MSASRRLPRLSALLDLALKDRSASSNAPLSGASKVSRDQNRGEAHGTEDGDVRRADTGTIGSRRARQMDLFKTDQPDGVIGAPAWPELPVEARAALTGLMTQLILQHAGEDADATREGGRS